MNNNISYIHFSSLSFDHSQLCQLTCSFNPVTDSKKKNGSNNSNNNNNNNSSRFLNYRNSPFGLECLCRDLCLDHGILCSPFSSEEKTIIVLSFQNGASNTVDKIKQSNLKVLEKGSVGDVSVFVFEKCLKLLIQVKLSTLGWSQVSEYFVKGNIFECYQGDSESLGVPLEVCQMDMKIYDDSKKLRFCFKDPSLARYKPAVCIKESFESGFDSNLNMCSVLPDLTIGCLERVSEKPPPFSNTQLKTIEDYRSLWWGNFGYRLPEKMSFGVIKNYNHEIVSYPLCCVWTVAGLQITRRDSSIVGKGIIQKLIKDIETIVWIETQNKIISFNPSTEQPLVPVANWAKLSSIKSNQNGEMVESKCSSELPINIGFYKPQVKVQNYSAPTTNSIATPSSLNHTQQPPVPKISVVFRKPITPSLKMISKSEPSVKIMALPKKTKEKDDKPKKKPSTKSKTSESKAQGTEKPKKKSSKKTLEFVTISNNNNDNNNNTTAQEISSTTSNTTTNPTTEPPQLTPSHNSTQLQTIAPLPQNSTEQTQVDHPIQSNSQNPPKQESTNPSQSIEPQNVTKKKKSKSTKKKLDSSSASQTQQAVSNNDTQKSITENKPDETTVVKKPKKKSPSKKVSKDSKDSKDSKEPTQESSTLATEQTSPTPPNQHEVPQDSNQPPINKPTQQNPTTSNPQEQKKAKKSSSKKRSEQTEEKGEKSPKPKKRTKKTSDTTNTQNNTQTTSILQEPPSTTPKKRGPKEGKQKESNKKQKTENTKPKSEQPQSQPVAAKEE